MKSSSVSTKRKLTVLNTPIENLFTGISSDCLCCIVITTFYDNENRHEKYSTFHKGKNLNTYFQCREMSDYSKGLKSLLELSQEECRMFYICGERKRKVIFQLISRYTISDKWECDQQIVLSNF